eukprot:CAMPEP_0197827816 /NCGR_PEP_ID=MMETSP1437-20131217/4518_1 /TAXON_ID=49252 ORGANISM="Eucampia antarctica, Strain CCMP1452" /NCGR_SAMPLE_ID=MMETSP1437 /ASSEMBLY_ACC=CAM_ASM_001096 /LENGTH=306 /DNA_ID=CAMNT_0043428809 /DNA_START=37 /DNA_END=957 /DNA_ORIENTATION=-
MEEDEAEEGIPFALYDEDDLQMIVDEDRLDSLVEMKGCQTVHNGDGMKQNESINGQITPVLGQHMHRGTVAFEIDLNSYQGLTSLNFVHHETQAEIQIKLPLLFSTHEDTQSTLSAEKEDILRHDTSSDGDENLDIYESDGFVVDDDYLSEKSDDDSCCICHDGGHMIVCDGGENARTCGKNFHPKCINHSEIPQGDWICQSCAEGIDVIVGVEGHEFPLNEEEFHDTEESDRDDEDEIQIRRLKRKKIDDETNAELSEDATSVLSSNAIENEMNSSNFLLDSDDDEPKCKRGKKRSHLEEDDDDE